MWAFNNESLHLHTPRNFMAGNTVYLQDEITSDNCAYLIADITNYITGEENFGQQIKFIINSPGGEVFVAHQISGLIAMAKLNNIQVITIVLGYAASAASMIAIQGDFRVMGRNAMHMVHFGSIWQEITKQTEIKKSLEYNSRLSKNMQQLYLDFCPGLTKERLQQLEEDEFGKLFADECLKLGFCDSIVEDELDKKNKEEMAEITQYKEFVAFKKSSKKRK
mgnify:CR=1 FL=1